MSSIPTPAIPTTPTISMTNNLGSPTTPSTPLAPGVQQRLSLKQTAIDTWSMKEQLGLASAVLRSGDQNWVSVSRQMKPFSQDGRPQDWFSQKNCALQYKLLLDKVDTPRRKRGEKAVESVETPFKQFKVFSQLNLSKNASLLKLLKHFKWWCTCGNC